MADNSSSSVASVAIVIIVILAGLGVWYFLSHNGMKSTTDTTNVEVKVPTTNNAPAKP